MAPPIVKVALAIVRGGPGHCQGVALGTPLGGLPGPQTLHDEHVKSTLQIILAGLVHSHCIPIYDSANNES